MNRLKIILISFTTIALVGTSLPVGAAELSDSADLTDTEVSETDSIDTDALDVEASIQDSAEEIEPEEDLTDGVTAEDNLDTTVETEDIAVDISAEDTAVFPEEEQIDHEEDFGISTLAATMTSDYKTTWNGTTYYHSPVVAAGKSILPGIDVSQFQGDVNWTKVAASGIQFAMIRLGYTSQYDQSINLDSQFKTNISGAKSAGLKVGVYYRSQARTVSEAIEEANYTIKQLSSYSLDLPVAVDYEYYDGGTVTSTYPDKATKTAILNAFCDTITAAGYRAIMYLNLDILTTDVNESDLNYGLWLARWTTGVPDSSRSYEFWQCSGGGATVDGVSGGVDLDWWYTSSTDIEKINGTWTYTVNGTPDYTYTGLAKNSNGWWYVKDGVVGFDYTGFAENSNGKWYCEDSKVTFSTNGVFKDSTGAIGTKGTWYYVVGSKVQTSYTGVADYKNANGWWYIKNGAVDFTANTVAKNKNGWWYVLGGKVQFGFTGLADYKNANGWWYIKEGKVDFTHSGVNKNKNGWWYISDGKVQFSYNGFASNSNGKWYCEGGKVTFAKNSVIKDATGAIGTKNTWYYVVESKVQTGFTGLANYKNGNGWWYIRNGVVDFTHNGVDKNKNGWWYVTDGKVQFGFTGLADYRNANGWWYIRGGAVDFTANTVAQNKNGWWYVKDGKVDFSFTGSVTVSGVKYTVQGGKVDR